MRNLSLFVILCSSLLLFSCDEEKREEKAEITFRVELTNGSEKLMLNETAILDNQSEVRVSLFRMYLSEIHLRKTNGEKVKLKEVMLADLGTEANNSFSISVDEANFEALEMGLGLTEELNARDPNSFENSHPLSAYQTMYWGMIKYRFVKFEGMARLPGGGPGDDILLSYHPGTDPLFRQAEFDLPLSVKNGDKLTVLLSVDLNELLAATAAFNFQIESQTHSSSPQGLAIADKFMAELQKSCSVSSSQQ